MKKKVVLSPGSYLGEEVIFIRFSYDDEMIVAIKSMRTARWLKAERAWTIALKDFSLQSMFQAMKHIAYIDYSALPRGMVREFRSDGRGEAGERFGKGRIAEPEASRC